MYIYLDEDIQLNDPPNIAYSTNNQHSQLTTNNLNTLNSMNNMDQNDEQNAYQHDQYADEPYVDDDNPYTQQGGFQVL